MDLPHSARYLAETEDLLEVGLDEPNLNQMTLDELWGKVRHIAAVMLASELLETGEDNPIESRMMLMAVSRAQGRRGQGIISFDMGSLTTELGLDPDEPWLAVQGFPYVYTSMPVRGPFIDASPYPGPLVRVGWVTSIKGLGSLIW